MRHKGLVMCAVFAVVALFAVTSWGAGKMLSAGSDRVFRGADWDVVEITGDVAIDSAGGSQIGANTVGGTEIDDTGDYIVNSLTVTGDLTVQGDSNPIAEMWGEELTFSVGAGAWTNVTGMTNGVASSSMAQNSTDGSVTVTYGGIYKYIASFSVEDNDGPTEEFHILPAIDGTPQHPKCEQHRSLASQAFLASVSVSCALDLLAGEVVTTLINSAGGDDPTLEHINWMLFK